MEATFPLPHISSAAKQRCTVYEACVIPTERGKSFACSYLSHVRFQNTPVPLSWNVSFLTCQNDPKKPLQTAKESEARKKHQFWSTPAWLRGCWHLNIIFLYGKFWGSRSWQRFSRKTKKDRYLFKKTLLHSCERAKRLAEWSCKREWKHLWFQGQEFSTLLSKEKQ